jgi:hypothetical protein
VPAAALSIALGAAQLAAAVPSEAATASSTAQVAVGHVPTLPKNAVAAAAPAASKQLSLDIELNTGHAGQLAQYASAVSEKSSIYYHQYLSPKQIAEYFGASSAEVSAVQSALKAQCLSVGSLSSDGMFLQATGTVAQLEQAFSVKISGYRSAGRSFYANTTAPTVSSSISGDVSEIVGLDNVDYAVSHAEATGHVAKAGAVAASAKVTANYSTGSCSRITTAWNLYNQENETDLQNGSGYYLDNTLSSIYGLSSQLAAGNDGAGVTVAVFELENYDPTGVADIDSCYGHSTSVTEVKVDGGPKTAPNLYTQYGIEAALDIENIANLAPGVKIVDYAGPDASVATEANILDTYGSIFNADTAKVVSTSWGLCEPKSDYLDSSMLSEENTLFAQAAAQGQSVVAASGDSGDTDCYGTGYEDSSLSVDDPASQPFVTGVGGTTMTGTSNPTPSVWNKCDEFDGTEYCGAGGGGVSADWPLPSWQAGAIGSGYTTNCANAASTGCREVPDVSALADLDEGYVIDEAYNDGNPADTGDSFSIVGGTSGAAPVWAAVLALVDASTSCRLNGEAGFVSPALFTAGEGPSASSVFTDVTSGNNSITEYGATYGYPATAGYDLASGWGTPKATGVANAICQTSNVSSQASYFVSDGPTRALNTRNGTGGTTGPIAVDGTVKLQVTGNGTNQIPADGVTAVVLNVTVADPTGGGYATVYPDGASRPVASNINFSKGEAIPNLVTVNVGSDGAIDLYNGSTGTANFLGDIEGYYTTDSTVSGVSTYKADGPTRVLNTRNGTGGVTGPITAGNVASLSLQNDGIPANATVVMNVTVADETAGGYATVYPSSDTTRPSTSNLNFSAKQVISNLVTVNVGSDDTVDFYNGTPGTMSFIADLEGYYTAGTSGAKFHALSPIRLADTRIGEGGTSVAPLAKSGGTLTMPLPASYSAVVENLTVTGPVGGGYLSAYPIGGSPTASSNVNFSAGQTLPNAAIVTSSGGVSYANEASGTTQLVVDIDGYFSAS